MFKLIIWTLFLGATVSSAWISEEPIIPGKSIGSIKLGMSEKEITLLNKFVKCTVVFTLQTGKAVELMTSTGGPCKTESGVQVASRFESLMIRYGPPEKKVLDEEFSEQLQSWWLYYDSSGVAFRVLFDSERKIGIVTAIKVFNIGTEA
jgi:hypothetical protein